jgi:hypothetical protein
MSLTILLFLGCNSGGEKVDISEDTSTDTEMDMDSDAELIVCKFHEDTQACTPGCWAIKHKEWIATINEEGQCAVEFTDNVFHFCNWWANFIHPDDRGWTGHDTISYRYLENGEVEARFLDSPMDPREGHGFINEWIACADRTVLDHPEICNICISLPIDVPPPTGM